MAQKTRHVLMTDSRFPGPRLSCSCGAAIASRSYMASQSCCATTCAPATTSGERRRRMLLAFRLMPTPPRRLRRTPLIRSSRDRSSGPAGTCTAAHKSRSSIPTAPLNLPQGEEPHLPGRRLQLGPLVSWRQRNRLSALVAIDPSLDAVLAGARVARQLGLRVAFLVADARHMPFRDHTADVVFVLRAAAPGQEGGAGRAEGDRAASPVRRACQDPDGQPIRHPAAGQSNS